MTNYEKFKNEIAALGYDFGVTKTQDICFCPTLICAECVLYADNERSCVPTKIQWLYEEAKEIFPITTKEKDFLDILWGSSYIARDYNGRLYLYSQKPVQLSDGWLIDNGYEDMDGNIFEICPDFFEFITWESDKCWSVEELRQMPVEEQESTR